MLNRRKKKIIGILSIVVVFLIILGLVAYNLFTPKDIYDFPSLTGNKLLSVDEYIEDFNYLYDTLRDYYPYFKINEDLNAIDWLANKDVYLKDIESTKDDSDFFLKIENILSDLNQGHTDIIPEEYGIDYYLSYRTFPRIDFRSDIADLYENSLVQNRYGISNERIKSYQKSLEEGMGEDNLEYQNAYMGDIDENIAYIYIPSMISPDMDIYLFEKDYDNITRYLKEIKNHDALVIDIRGNGGGNSGYWQEFLIPRLIDDSLQVKEYTFIKKGPLTNKIRYTFGYEELDLSKLDFPDKTINYIKEFDYMEDNESIYHANDQSIRFNGQIYLLVDEKVYSSSEKLATFMKESNLAILIGSRTGGDGIGTDPIQIALPNSGYVVRFPKEMGVTGKGNISELDKTMPHIQVNPERKISIDKDGSLEINNDECIEKVIEEESIN